MLHFGDIIIPVIMSALKSSLINVLVTDWQQWWNTWLFLFNKLNLVTQSICSLLQ